MARTLWIACALFALSAGCSSPPAAVPAPPLEPTPVVVDDAVDWSGTMSSSYCVNANGAVACGSGLSILGTGAGDGKPTYWHEAADRLLVGGDLTLQWEPTAPSTEVLRVVVAAYVGCPDECEPFRSVSSETGPSPLAVRVSRLTLSPDETALGLTIAVRVEPVEFAPGAQASIGQDLRLAGTLSFVMAPDDPSRAREGEQGEGGGTADELA